MFDSLYQNVRRCYMMTQNAYNSDEDPLLPISDDWMLCQDMAKTHQNIANQDKVSQVIKNKSWLRILECQFYHTIINSNEKNFTVTRNNAKFNSMSNKNVRYHTYVGLLIYFEYSTVADAKNLVFDRRK